MSVFSTEIDVVNTPLPIEGGNPTAVKVDGSAVTQPVSGTVTVSNPGLTDSELRATPVPISGSVSTTPLSATASTVTQITSTGSNQMLLAANGSRKKAIFFFSSGIWNVKFGSGASSTSRTYTVSSANTTIEVTIWTGQIDAACTTAGKLVDVTELV